MEGKRPMRYLMAAAAALTVGACATNSSETAEEDAASYFEDPRLGEKVNRICFARQIDGFRFLEEYDRAVLLESRVNDWHFVELLGPCTNRSLRFARAVAIDSGPGGGCLTRGDRLVFADSIAFRTLSATDVTRCVIGDVYVWNEDAGAPETEDEESEGGAE